MQGCEPTLPHLHFVLCTAELTPELCFPSPTLKLIPQPTPDHKPMMFPIFSLPNELIDAIVSAVGDRPTLLALAQTCSRLQPFAEAQLFKSVYIRDGPSVSRLSKSLEQPPERVRAVEHLEVTPTMHSWDGIALMPELIMRLARLKSLKLESPMINTGRRPSWWADEIMVEYMDLFAENGARGALECLTSCKLLLHPQRVQSKSGHLYYQVTSVSIIPTTHCDLPAGLILIIEFQRSHSPLSRHQQPVLQYQNSSASLSVADTQTSTSVMC